MGIRQGRGERADMSAWKLSFLNDILLFPLPISFYLGLQKGRHASEWPDGAAPANPAPFTGECPIPLLNAPYREKASRQNEALAGAQFIIPPLPPPDRMPSQIFPPFVPLYARQMRLIVSTSPTSVVSNSYSARPMTAVAALRPHTNSLRMPGMRFLGM